MTQLRLIFRLARPLHLLLALLTYGLGLGIARYLGTTLSAEPQILGGVIVLLLLAASSLLTEYFRPFNEPILPDEAPRGNGASREREQLRALLLQVSAAFVAVAVVSAFLLQQAGFLRTESALLFAAFTLLALANAVPPVRLINRGLGEFILAILIGTFTPTLAFMLQTGQFHRLLTIFTFPLVLLGVVYFLALNFPGYADDLKYERRSLLISLTWQRAVPIHNLLLIAAYGILAAVPFLGVSFSLVWPALLTLPIAAYQMFVLRNIAEGARPVWPVFITTATAIFGLSAYLLTLTFWLR